MASEAQNSGALGGALNRNLLFLYCRRSIRSELAEQQDGGLYTPISPNQKHLNAESKHPMVCSGTEGRGVNLRRKLEIERIKSRIKDCEADRRWLLRMVATSQVNLAWISKRVDENEKDLRVLSRQLQHLETLESEESA